MTQIIDFKKRKKNKKEQEARYCQLDCKKTKIKDMIMWYSIPAL